LNYDLDDASGEDDSLEDQQILEGLWVKDWDEEETNEKFLEQIKDEIAIFKVTN